MALALCLDNSQSSHPTLQETKYFPKTSNCSFKLQAFFPVTPAQPISAALLLNLRASTRQNGNGIGGGNIFFAFGVCAHANTHYDDEESLTAEEIYEFLDLKASLVWDSSATPAPLFYSSLSLFRQMDGTSQAWSTLGSVIPNTSCCHGVFLSATPPFFSFLDTAEQSVPAEMIEISRRVWGWGRLCVFLHDEMDCLQVHSGEETLEVKEEICKSRIQGDTRWIR